MPHKLTIQVRETERPWKKDAACKGTNPNLFFPDGAGKKEQEKAAIAQAICAECDVREECLEYALLNNERHGIWGGESERSRHTIRRRRGMFKAREASQKRTTLLTTI